MNNLNMIIQIVIALGIYNVWLLRFGKSTSWRGKGAQNMEEEFKAYGLPPMFMYLVGFLKLCFASLMLVGIANPTLVRPSAIGMAVLMIGAIGMHFKVGDPAKKSLPAAIMLGLSLILIF